MTRAPSLSVEAVSKRYRRGGPAYGTFRDGVAGLLRRRPPRAPPRTVTALDDVSFEVAPGEMLAVVGRNGAGKTTLLKVVARITHPDRGRVVVHGRLSALIEVGAGFHPELTGRENVLLHGSILGLPRRLLRHDVDAIATFAGVRDALDTPVKHFSTGMYARLGFAVAVHASPALLLVDEVLSVGDEPFRVRCYDRIRSLRREGTAVLFVSHDLAAVEAHAERAAWLDRGRIARSGAPGEVVRAYREAVLPAP